MSVRILVVGAGSIGRRHHQNLALLGADSVLMPYREFAKSPDPVGTGSAMGFDALVIATATQIRAELIELCVEHALPFYVEKPLTHDISTLRSIAEMALPIAKRSMVGFMMRYHPAFRALAQMDLSDIYRFSFEIGHDVRQWRQNWHFSESYAARPDGGGVLLDLCHELDMAHCLFPNARLSAVDCLGHDAFPGVDFATRVTLSGQPDSPAPLGQVAMDYLSPVSVRRAALRGQMQTVDFDFVAGRYGIDTGLGPRLLDFAFERNDMFLAAMRDFLDLVAGRPVSDVEHLPRLDLVMQSCVLIAQATAARQFRGSITGDFT